MGIFGTIIIIAVGGWMAYQLTPQYREGQIQKHTEKLEDYAYRVFFELIEDYEKKIRRWEKDAKKRGVPFPGIKNYKKGIVELKDIEAKYVRLKERNAHKRVKKLNQLAQDWHKYITGYRSIRDYNRHAWNWNPEDVQDDYIMLQEVEGRFNKMLGIKSKKAIATRQGC